MTRQELIDHITETYSASPEYPFPRDNESCVFRHSGNRKWFALVMRVPYQTLRQDREGIADILNIKCDPFLIGSLRGRPGFLPAYHMNKDKWLTVLLDGSADSETITSLLGLSFDLTKPKPVRKKETPSDDLKRTTKGLRKALND